GDAQLRAERLPHDLVGREPERQQRLSERQLACRLLGQGMRQFVRRYRAAGYEDFAQATPLARAGSRRGSIVVDGHVGRNDALFCANASTGQGRCPQPRPVLGCGSSRKRTPSRRPLGRLEPAMSRTHAVIIVATVLTALLTTAPGARTVREPITRTVYVTVLDNDGQPATDLTPKDFRLREGNRDREITSVEPATDRMRIAVMVEELLTPTGGVRQGMGEFMQAMITRAEISLIVVGQSNREAVPYTTDLSALIAGINGLPLNQRQQTNHVPEGVFEVSKTFVAERPARPVMVVIALDSLQASSAEPQHVLNTLRDSNAQLHAVSIQTPQSAV